MEKFIHKLKRVEGLSLDQLKEEIKKGGRFIIFPYTISLFITRYMFSSAYFIRQGEEVSQFSKKYSLRTALFGWWGLVGGFGPVNSIKSLAMNRKGGLDITGDIMVNLTEKSLQKQEVEIEQMETLFIKVDKSNRKQIMKAMKKFRENGPVFSEYYIGLFVNVEGDERPVFTIGLPIDLNENIAAKLDACIRKQFYNHVPFSYVSTLIDEDYIQLLKEQGEKIEFLNQL